MFKFKVPLSEDSKEVHISLGHVVSVEFSSSYHRDDMAWVTLTNDTYAISVKDARRLLKALHLYWGASL